MMDERLPARLEATAIIRRVESGGDFAAILNRGDPDRGALVLVLQTRGRFCGILERQMGADFRYDWVLSRADEDPNPEEIANLVAAKRRIDPDCWLIELDIADPERFIAETTFSA